MDKPTLRSTMRDRLAALPPSTRSVGEELVNAAIISDPLFGRAHTVLCYMAKAPELSVVSTVLAAWRAGKVVAFPRVAGDRLHLHRVTAWDGLLPGAFGIREPSAGAPEVDPSQVDLAIVPGLAFDGEGGRLGQGGGYYDRLLPRIDGVAVGVAFDEQLVDAVPREPHDAGVDRVITPDSAMR